MSPATRMPATDSVIVPLETMSPVTDRVPMPPMEMAVPPAPPHPAWFSAATVGVYRRLLTPPEDEPLRVGLAPLVRILANCSWSDRVAMNLNWLPCAPRADTTCVSVVPSPNEHVIVSGLAPGAAYAGAQEGDP